MSLELKRSVLSSFVLLILIFQCDGIILYYILFFVRVLSNSFRGSFANIFPPYFISLLGKMSFLSSFLFFNLCKCMCMCKCMHKCACNFGSSISVSKLILYSFSSLFWLKSYSFSKRDMQNYLDFNDLCCNFNTCFFDP